MDGGREDEEGGATTVAHVQGSLGIPSPTTVLQHPQPGVREGGREGGRRRSDRRLQHKHQRLLYISKDE